MIIIGKQRPQWPVYQAGNKRLNLPRPSHIPSKKIPGYLPTGVRHFQIFHRQGKKIDPLTNLICCNGGHQYNGFTGCDNDRPVCLFGNTTCFNIDIPATNLNRVIFHHYFIYPFK